MDTMDWKLEIKLVGPEGAQREELFLGRDAHDLAMLGAAQGYLRGLYRAAEPASFLMGVEKGMAELPDLMQRVLNPPQRPIPPFQHCEIFQTPEGVITVKATNEAAIRRAVLLLGPSPAGVLKERVENIREELLSVIKQVLASGIMQPEDLAELAGRPA